MLSTAPLFGFIQQRRYCSDVRKEKASGNRKAKISAEHVAEAVRLKSLWDSREHETQVVFGEKYSIGNQSAVGQFLRGEAPLSIKAAKGFAEGLHCSIADFSPRLAKEILEMASGLVKGPAIEREAPPFAAEPKVQYLAEKRPSAMLLQLAELLRPMDETDRKIAKAILVDLVDNPDKAEQMASKFERVLGGGRDSQVQGEQRFGV